MKILNSHAAELFFQRDTRDRSSWRTIAKRLAATLVLALPCSQALADVAPVAVSGNKVLFGGKPASIAGMSFYWSNNGWPGARFYNAGAVKYVKDDFRGNLVRAAMGVEDAGGYLQFPAENKARVKAVVDAAIANDMYVIIDWHSHYAQRHQNEAIAFFQEMARTYGNNKHVIYEIYNEPKNDSTWEGNVKPYAQAVIAAIRAIDPDNLIIVGTPTWSQDVDVASRSPITGYPNIAYTLHFYAGTHKQALRDKASTAMNNGIALFVTEWGAVNADGNGGVDTAETTTWVNFMKTHGLSHANWALDDANEGSAALVPGSSATGGWTSANYTASGKFVRDIIRAWPPLTTSGCATPLLPATIQAEGYCQMSGVQTQTTTDTGGGQNVSTIDAGDWMSYGIDVPAAGRYKVSYRVASTGTSGNISLERAAGGVLGAIAVPATGGLQTWRTISHEVDLAAGKQTLRLAVKGGGFNLNWLQIEAVGSTTPQQIALIQAESYSAMNGVQIEQTSDVGGGSNVGYIDAGDSMTYAQAPVVIDQAGDYLVEFRVASTGGGGELILEEAGTRAPYTRVAVPATGGWQSWTTLTRTVSLPAGTRTFGIYANQGGWNLNWFRVSKVR